MSALLSVALLVSLGTNMSAAGISAADDSTSSPQLEAPRVYNTVRLTGERPVIDGRFNDPCWQLGEWAGNFTQWISILVFHLVPDANGTIPTA